MPGRAYETGSAVIERQLDGWYAVSHRLVALAWRIAGPTTVGVKVLVTTPDDRVLLVRTRYHAGWSLPGEGVHRGEPVAMAAARELAEEAGLIVHEGDLRLLGVLSNVAGHKNDIIVVFHVALDRGSEIACGRELADAAFQLIHALPGTTTLATRRRVAELQRGEVPRGKW